jgi:two-component system chemotaxis response regulator CheB
MRLRPMPVVMVSTLTERGAEVTLRRWSWARWTSSPSPRSASPTACASWAPTSPTRSAPRRARACTGWRRPRRRPHPRPRRTPPAALGRLSTEKIIFIGASTGGTEATREVLMACRPTFRR